MCFLPLIKMIFPSYLETHCHCYPVDQTYSVHERTNRPIVTLPCKSDLHVLSASWKNKTDLLSPLACESDSAWSDQVYFYHSPFRWDAWPICRTTSPQIFMCKYPFIHCRGDRPSESKRSLLRKRWSTMLFCFASLCKFIPLLTSLPYNICDRLWPWLGLKPALLDPDFSTLTTRPWAFHIIFFGTNLWHFRIYPYPTQGGWLDIPRGCLHSLSF